MKLAQLTTPVDVRAIADAGVSVEALVPLPPADWFVRGPRGGLYQAIGQRRRSVSDQGEYFIRNQVLVVDTATARYVRPGTRLHAIGRRVAI